MVPNNQPARPISWEAKKNFEKSREKIDHLWKIHEEMGGDKPVFLRVVQMFLRIVQVFLRVVQMFPREPLN